MSFMLDGDNEFAVIGSILNNDTLSSYQIQTRKFMYLEGLIRFLELYAQNEIGDVEVDIEKIALWINSPYFENINIYVIKDMESIYAMLTNDILNNIPLYRFLKLDNYKLKILEQDHYNRLLESFKKDYEDYQCLKCIWYQTEDFSFGRSSKCCLPKEQILHTFIPQRNGYHKITDEKNRNCKYCTTISNKDKFIDKYITNNKKFLGSKNNIIVEIDNYVKKWIDKVNNLDNSYIPINIPDSAKVDLDAEDNAYADLSRVLKNKKTKQEMKKNLRYAIFLEAMIKFVEIYAQTELGNDYIADISNIAKYLSNITLEFNSKDEFYIYLENQIINGFNIINFCKRKEF